MKKHPPSPLIAYNEFRLVHVNDGFWDGTFEAANLAAEEGLRLHRMHPDVRAKCQFCSSSMTFQETFLTEHAPTSIHHCMKCGWWKLECLSSEASVSNTRYSNDYICQAIARKYDVSDKQAPVDALHRHLRRYVNDFAHVEPKRLEHLVTSVLSDFFGNTKTRHVGGNRDQGIDILCCRTDREDFLVQVKRREDIDKKEAFEVVDSILGACVRYVDRENLSISDVESLVITTASGYTPRAIETAGASLRKLGLKITVFDKDDLHNLLVLTPPKSYAPWLVAEKQVAEKLKVYP